MQVLILISINIETISANRKKRKCLDFIKQKTPVYTGVFCLILSRKSYFTATTTEELTHIALIFIW